MEAEQFIEFESSKNYYDACKHALKLPNESIHFEIQFFKIDNSYNLEIDSVKFQEYLENRVASSENELLKLFYIPKLYQLYKINGVTEKLKDIKVNFIDNIFTIYNSDTYNLEGEPFAIVLKSYLELLYSSLGKKLRKNVLDCLLENLENNPISKRIYFSLCANNIFSCLKHDDEKKKLLQHFSDYFKNTTIDNNDIETLEILINQSTKYSSINQAIVENYFSYIFNTIQSMSGIQKLIIIKRALSFTEHHLDSKKVRNDLLFAVLNTISEIKEEQESTYTSFSNSSQIKHQTYISNTKAVFAKYDTLNCLRFMVDKFFNFIKQKPEDIEHEFHASQISYQLTTDDDGLPLHDVTSLEDRFFEKYKMQLIVYLNYLILPLFEYVENKACFNETIQAINIFNEESNEVMSDIMRNYIDGDYFSFFSKAVPLIERKLRLFLRQFGESDIKTNSQGGFDYKTMSAFFESDVIKEKFTPSSIYVLKLIYDDRRGLNFRNKLAHGLFGFNEVQKLHAVSVLLTLIFIDALNEKFESGV